MRTNKKRELARKMLTQEEREKGVNVYDSVAWGQRKAERRFRVNSIENNTQLDMQTAFDNFSAIMAYFKKPKTKTI